MAASVAHKFVERVDSNEDWHVLVEKTTGSLIGALPCTCISLTVRVA